MPVRLKRRKKRTMRRMTVTRMRTVMMALSMMIERSAGFADEVTGVEKVL